MHLNINFDQLREVALNGIRRSAVFLGLGVNSARDPRFSDYELTKITLIRLVPANADAQVVRGYKKAFEEWIIACGLRELTETFAIFLDGVHRSCLIMATHQKEIPPEEATKSGPAFEWKGIEEKLAKLKTCFGVETQKEKYLVSINRVRNCFTHRRGLVGRPDVGAEDCLRLQWWGMEMFIQTPNNDVIPIPASFPEEGIYLKDGGTLCMKFTDRVKEFKLGQLIAISPNDLAEMCFLAQLATDEILKSAFNYASKIGIPLRESK